MSATKNYYDEGYDAGWDGKTARQNPYPLDSEAGREWEQGRHDGKTDKYDNHATER